MSTSIFQRTFTIDADDTYILKTGQPDGHGRRSRRTIKLTKSSYNGSITVKSRPRGSSGAFTEQPYEKEYLNAAAGDGSKVTTAITDNSTITIDDSGKEIALVGAGRSAGSMAVETTTVTDQ